MAANFGMILCIFAGFVLGAFLYRSGLKDGLSVQKGEPLKSVNPVPKVKSVVKKVVEAKAESKEKEIQRKAEERYIADLAELLSYDGTEHVKPGGGVNEN